MSQAELIKQWHFRNHRVQLAHYESARRYQRLHIMLGLPAVILSTFVGTAVFATLSKETELQVPLPGGAMSLSATQLHLLLGLLSVAAALLTGLQTFLKFSELAEKHRLAGSRFANLKHRIEMLATFPEATPVEVRDTLTAIETSWAKLREESPTLPASIWRRFERTMLYDKHQCP